MIYITSILFTLAFVFYFKWQKVSDDGGIKGKWHTWGFFMRILFFIAVVIEHYFPSNMWDVLFAGTICVLVYEIGINVIALHEKWNYVGSTSETDIKLGKMKWYIYFGALLSAAVLKIINSIKSKK